MLLLNIYLLFVKHDMYTIHMEVSCSQGELNQGFQLAIQLSIELKQLTVRITIKNTKYEF